NLAQIAGENQLAPPEEVNDLFRAAVTAGESTNLRVALYTAGNWARWHEQREDWPAATTAYEAALRAMHALQRLQVGRLDRERWLSAAQGISARAAFAATSGERPDPYLGLRLLDRGQAVLLTATLTSADAPGEPAVSVFEPTAEPLPPPDLAGDGPVVALCATARGGRAVLVLVSGEVRHLALPTVTTQRVAQWAGAISAVAPGRLSALLTELSREIMQPVLAACPSDLEQLILLP